MSAYFDTREGRALFGLDPQNYHDIRPPYPEPLYDFLRETGALYVGAATLEIGAGSGLATRPLLDLGVHPLTIVEPDARFAPLLEPLAASYPADIRLIADSFEEAELPRGEYDLVAAATSFHWVEPSCGLAKVADLLRPGGYVALWWNVFGDDAREDPFHEATQTILRPLASSPSGAPDTVPFALDVPARLRDFERAGQFEPPVHTAYRWTLALNAAEVRALYATFSPISRLPQAQREDILDRLREVAEERFGGVVERNMVSPVYVARRR